MRVEQQVKPIQTAIHTHDLCERCAREIPSAFQIAHPGTDICDYCAAIHIGADFDEEER